MIKVQVNGKGFYDCLVDTGASKSCINEHFVQRLGLKINPIGKKDNSFFLVADGGAIHVKGITSITLTIGNIEYVEEFHVLNKLSTDMLLGVEFLVQNKGIMNYEDRTLILDTGLVKVPLCKIGDHLGMAIVAETIVIPPNSQMIVPILTTRDIPYSLTLIEPLDNDNARGIKLARTLVKSKGPKHCPIWNDSDLEIRVPKFSPVGTLTSISDIIDSVDEDNQQPYLPQNPKLLKHKFDDLKIKLSNEKLTDEQKLKFKNLVDK